MTPEDWAPEHERRSETRRHLLFATTIASEDGGKGQPVLVRDISPRGLLLEMEEGSVLDPDFLITLPEAGDVSAHVIWQGDKLAGCRLESELNQATIDAVRETGDHDHGGPADGDDYSGGEPLEDSAATTLAARLKQLRLARDLTRAELAERSGISTPSIWAWETGRTVPRLQSLETLAKGLGVPVSELKIGAAPAPPAMRPVGVEGDGRASRLRELVEASRSQIAALAGTTPDRVSITITL